MAEDFDLDDFLPYQLAVVASRMSRALTDVYAAESGLSMPEWRIMAHLMSTQAVSVREIHQRTDLDKSKVSRACDRLEAEGLLRKTISAQDRRLVELELTPAGRDLMSRLIPLAQDFQARLLDGIGEDAAVFQSVLARIMKELK
ncbi:DNA-binding MarR family transcriptional regulator [Pseudaminobacter salicylatoxidans]|uniref:DNA-binding MarR family transcriptional regulator n=1 Tax=Pseudaminobacter salicylatoxidans TaxID=93369 RepID=A0A316C3T4_PSESE|nr:MarR family winged helix-turn-helix transcriptional regulator [Pseudaminobacter salicylatoxidans]PWJ84412.1 DNA-binding MarR family transcriptional regulator [Pseudaminobacter salicylatoxidans]